MFINTETQKVINIRQLRKAIPNISLPSNPPEDLINTRGFASVQPTERPTGDVVTEGQPELRDGWCYQMR